MPTAKGSRLQGRPHADGYAFTETYPDSIRVPFAAYALYYDAHERGDADQALSYLTRAAETAPEGRFGTAMRDMQAQAKKQR